MPLAARWTPLPPLPSELIRSSHALAVVDRTAWIFGGELKPRTPLGANLIAISLKDGHSRTLPPSSSTPWPAPRVGASLIALGTSLYLWGGRGGKSMAPFSPEEDLWKFDTEKESWEQLETEGERPEQRSFHAMAAHGNILYLHAGCPSSGRLETIHSLDLTHSPLTWTTCASAPGPARGGTALTSLPSSPLLARFGGFAGYELGGLDIFDTELGQWSTVDADVDGGGPGKRSVHMLIGLDGSLEWAGKKVVAVMALGEREGAPAELGHDGAGFVRASICIGRPSRSVC
ncbi:galactose oxidase [Athelia psychrophila]|uniref:Galactose oxidase n=1 Tax=Athelia psychrophila TaxID=1759441 RepID=A0A166QQ92_9AGAM|nr:galactose oxidase [Fibularhizoctonia sp. CBS 109695]